MVLPVTINTNNMLKFSKKYNIRSILVTIVFLSVIGWCLLYSTNEFALNEFASEAVTVTEGLKLVLGCIDKPFEVETSQDGPFWILKNYIRAAHGELSCGDSITYTTHGDFTFLDNLPVLIARWEAPVSFALYAPGTDFDRTLEAIMYIRNCMPESEFIQYYVIFHIYFVSNHMPDNIPLTETEALNWPYNCSLSPPYLNVNQSTIYRYKNNLLYPINVGRNIARKAAITHFILASDIELYPNPGFVQQFLEMVIRNSSILYGPRPRVFPLVVFEVNDKAPIPETKTQLQQLLSNKFAIPFHQKVCVNCHAVPNLSEWISANETDQLDVFSVGQRKSKYKYWEPFYVSDNQEPLFDTRVTWEGQKNKRIQGYAMCLLDYEFHVLNNAFLIHSPGIKINKKDPTREKHIKNMNSVIKKTIVPEYEILYGNKKGCVP